MKAPHEFDGIQAQGDWLVVLQVGTRTVSPGGLAIPEVSQLPIWEVVTAGERVTSCKVGERVVYAPPQKPTEGGGIEIDGRRYMFLRSDLIIATLPRDEDRPRLTLVSGHEARSVLQ